MGDLRTSIEKQPVMETVTRKHVDGNLDPKRADAAAEKRRRFRALHEVGTFLLPNPWDVGTAVYLERTT